MITAVLGIILLVFFLRNVDNGASPVWLFTGVILVSLGNVMAFLTIDKRLVHFFFILFITTFFLMTMFDVRFGTMQGSDITAEYVTSKITVNDGSWLLARADQGEAYFSSASVSILPAIICKVTGLDLMPIFQWVLRLVIAILPILIFLTVKEIFQNVKLAGLSALIFSQFYFNFNLLNFLIRQGIAEIFLVLTFFLVVKLHRSESKSLAYAVLIPFSMFGLVIGHYTLNYWSVIIIGFIFVLCFAIGSLPKKLLVLFRIVNLKMEKPILSSVFLVFFIAMSAFWIYFTNLTSFLITVHNELSLLSPRTTVISSISQSSWIFNNPAGPIVGYWFILTAALIAFGFVYAIFKIPKRSQHVPWIGGGLIMLGTMGLWVVAGNLMLGLYLDRIYTMGAIFFTTFAAFVLLFADKKLKVVVIIFLLLNLPINMLLPSYQRYVLYTQEKSVNPEVAVNQRYIRVPEFTAAVWLRQHAADNMTFYTDFGNAWYYAGDRVSYLHSEDPPTNTTNVNSVYFIFHYYNLKYSLWQKIIAGSTLGVTETFAIDSYLNSSSVFYNNGEAAITARVQTT